MGNLKDINYGIGKYLELSDATSLPDIGTNRKNLDLLNFKVAINNAYALYNFKDGMIDAYQTEAGVDTATSTNESYDSTNKVYGPLVVSPATTVFTSVATTSWSAPVGVTAVQVLVVAGGGGGGGDSGGGGGGGGVRYIASHPVTGGNNYTVTVGNFGGGQNTHGSDGGDSVFDSITSTGGGGGAYYGSTTGGDGGSGGGGSWTSGPGGAGNTPSTTPSQGYPGGDGGSTHQGAGGGGASQAGYDGGAGPAGHGGDGSLISAFSGYGASGYFGGGAGGGTHGSGAPGGAGGGGNGGGSGGQPASGGTVNTGGGGGGGKNNGPIGGWNGGTGFVGVITIANTTNMTLLSNAQTANAEPDTGRLMLYEEDVDAITLDTDLKGYVSRDGGTTYTQTPLVEDTTYVSQVVFNQGGIDSNTKLMLHCDGSDSGTTFTDSSASAHSVTANGNAHTDTTIKKFGTASLQCDGSGDYLNCGSSSDWDFGSGDFTLDCWAYFNSIPDQPRLFGDSGGNWFFRVGDCGGVKTISAYNGNWFCDDQYGVVTLNTWHHFAWSRQSGTNRFFFNGGLISDSAITDATISTSNLYIAGGVASQDLDGYMDEIRISNTARFTAAFVPATRLSEAYTDGTYTPAVAAQRLVSGSVDISGQPAGSNMKYKVETLNNKNLKLHGASLLWA